MAVGIEIDGRYPRSTSISAKALKKYAPDRHTERIIVPDGKL
jgi:hypothetical protein